MYTNLRVEDLKRDHDQQATAKLTVIQIYQSRHCYKRMVM